MLSICIYMNQSETEMKRNAEHVGTELNQPRDYELRENMYIDDTK